ncbi:hypothetical protein SJI19_13380 [Acerihabitans sp. TG2]|nr:hypothetical protein [Acerihabitans sp. TG2]MEA9391525.1 hypothetical protein [Acerihabitans sp. TG2]
MKKTLTALALVTALIAPAVSMAAAGDYHNYANTYPVAQGTQQHTNTAE